MNRKHKGIVMLISLIVLILALFIFGAIRVFTVGSNKLSDELSVKIDKATNIEITTSDEEFAKLQESNINFANEGVTDESTQYGLIDSVYCNNLRVDAFTNSNNNTKYVVSILDKENTEEIETFKLDNLSSHSEFSEQQRSYELNTIGNLLENIMENNRVGLIDNNADKYFTDDLYKNILDNIKDSDKEDNVDISFMKYGKSSLDCEYFDRIIVQLKSTMNSKLYTNILLKVDGNRKIYDIDIM